MINLNRLRSAFISTYGAAPRIFRAPGRINLVGEHTDYNDGYVLPAAIGFGTYVAAAPRSDRQIRAASMNFDHEIQFDLDDPERSVEQNWTKFIQGVGLTLEASGYKLRGADLLIESDVPVGAGLSSSAALEISAAFALASLSGHELTGMELARIGQTAEHKFAGVRSGIMDQFAAVHGQAGHALFLDCRSLEWFPIDLAHAQFIICDTKAKHDLADSEYNKRRTECEEAAKFFGRGSLRDVPPNEFEKRSVAMPEIQKKRARHVIAENQRVLDAVAALRSNDLAAFGKLMNESHESLRLDFEVSSNELDLMADLARRQKGVLGSRMMGGGFGGCTINLMEPGGHRSFVKKMAEDYHRETGIFPEIYECEIAGGVNEIG